MTSSNNPHELQKFREDGVTLHVSPEQTPLSWLQFVCVSPPNSIALDGYVYGRPQFEATGPRANFNHHEEVSRLETRATCAQVMLAIKQGLFQSFHDDDGRPRAELWVNDCDEDVCLSVFLLQHPTLLDNGEAGGWKLNRLVGIEDILDSTAGAYPYPTDLPMLETLAWVFEPYRTLRLTGGLARRNHTSFKEVIESVSDRIYAYIAGQSGRKPLDTRYTTVKRRGALALVEEQGSYGRTGMFQEGIQVFISMQAREDGKRDYRIGKISPFINCDLVSLIEALNTLEASSDPHDKWGGGDTIIGSPRNKGSSISPDEVWAVAEEFYKGP